MAGDNERFAYNATISARKCRLRRGTLALRGHAQEAGRGWADWDSDVTRAAGRLRDEEWNSSLRAAKFVPADGRCGSCGEWLDDYGECPYEAYGCEEWAVDEADRLRMRYEEGDVECCGCGHRFWSADVPRSGVVLCRTCREAGRSWEFYSW